MTEQLQLSIFSLIYPVFLRIRLMCGFIYVTLVHLQKSLKGLINLPEVMNKHGTGCLLQ